MTEKTEKQLQKERETNTKEFHAAMKAADWGKAHAILSKGLKNGWLLYEVRINSRRLPKEWLQSFIDKLNPSDMQELLNSAAQNKNIDLCRLLIEKGADIDQSLRAGYFFRPPQEEVESFRSQLGKFSGIVYVRQELKNAQLKKELTEAKAEITELRQALAELSAEVAEMRNPAAASLDKACRPCTPKALKQ